jgi:hypothetical protein
MRSVAGNSKYERDSVSQIAMLRLQRDLHVTVTAELVTSAVYWTLPVTDVQFLIIGRVLMVSSLNEGELGNIVLQEVTAVGSFKLRI